MGNVDWKNVQMDERTRKELLELDSVLGDFLGLGIEVEDYVGKYVYDGAGVGYGIGIVRRDGGFGCEWWYGKTLEDCFGFMMKDLKRKTILNGVVLPVFGSVSELRMKLELRGK